jgi:hypothetical protein
MPAFTGISVGGIPCATKEGAARPALLLEQTGGWAGYLPSAYGHPQRGFLSRRGWPAPSRASRRNERAVVQRTLTARDDGVHSASIRCRFSVVGAAKLRVLLSRS